MLAGIFVIAWVSSKLMRSVADFLAANRSAGRYLLTMASGMAGLGAISVAANFEKGYEAGFATAWWGQMLAPVGLILALSGFVVYRYRETRAMTMAQFFEVRYSRRFRIFAGILAWSAGLLNYGIFPAVTARFLVYFTGLPPELSLMGWGIPTIAPVMLVLLGIALTLTLSGGQIAVMITDFFQGQFVNIVLLIVIVVLATQIGWDTLIRGLQEAPKGQSKIDPFDQGKIPDFNPVFFFMLAALQIYHFKAWQGTQGYNASAKTAHEARMAGILAEFRGAVLYVMMLLVPVAAFAVLHLPEFHGVQQEVQSSLSTLDTGQLQKQMTVPVTLSHLLPVGVMGLFAAVIVAAAVSTDDTYLHSWGSIFVQDVVMPFRKKRLSQRAHMRLLRGSIFGVAGFGFVFSLVFPLEEYILMYFQITGAIYLGGAGSVILGGLYWKRGSVEGAWVAMATGSVLAVTGVVLRNIVWPYVLPGLQEGSPPDSFWNSLPATFPLNGVEMAFMVAGTCVGLYVLFSLLSRRPPIDMDRLLHRGPYAVTGDSAAGNAVSATPDRDTTPVDKMWRLLGVGAEFSRSDKLIYVLKIALALFFFGTFVIGTVLRLFWEVPESWWVNWWLFTIVYGFTLGAICIVWFLIGGFRDLFDLFRTLRHAQRDASDDGAVADEEHLQAK
ncbi:MAG: sodium:solute symporter [Planctomycetota bacterium]